MAVWDQVRSREEAEAQARGGALAAVQLLSAELGGAANVENIVYLPAAARADKDATTRELLALARDGKVSRVAVTPDYRGDSFVPATLHVRAWGDGDTVVYTRDLAIW